MSDNVGFYVVLGREFLFGMNVFMRCLLILGKLGGFIDKLYIMYSINCK